MNKLLFASLAVAMSTGVAMAADLDYPPLPPASIHPMPPLAYRPPGSPPGGTRFAMNDNPLPLSLDTIREVYPEVRARRNEAIRAWYSEGERHGYHVVSTDLID